MFYLFIFFLRYCWCVLLKLEIFQGKPTESTRKCNSLSIHDSEFYGLPRKRELTAAHHSHHAKDANEILKMIKSIYDLSEIPYTFIIQQFSLN